MSVAMRSMAALHCSAVNKTSALLSNPRAAAIFGMMMASFSNPKNKSRPRLQEAAAMFQK
ncbi:hypothetical protein LHK_02875 [Laribacter hongkongensis HLHK9]|uniref:Uncharacterized protein n=1 Tax=Laribacter hongkongensis (strain HLHK9) TaxID=557598 RepID=C1D4R3_LARHH|nr:hypothetical protein LHK_02875 [Laribacter hongkongensis HLHK9]